MLKEYKKKDNNNVNFYITDNRDYIGLNYRFKNKRHGLFYTLFKGIYKTKGLYNMGKPCSHWKYKKEKLNYFL